MATRLFLILALAGCHKTLSAEISQPNPYVAPGETLFVSEQLIIVTGDMDLEVPVGPGVSGQVMRKLPLVNTAYFVIVSHDRLRFRIQFEHKFDEYTDLATWQTSLKIDDRTYLPESVEPRKGKHKTKMWEYEQRSMVRDAYGDARYIANDGHKRRVPLASVDYFRGWGDLVFYSRDIFTRRTCKVVLVLTRGGITHRYSWFFGEGRCNGKSDRTAENVR